ncbi:prepilin-type N-terminal cleavage/methylation domain-containing protein [Patescibacteria group bacterium]|nr:prepilin-type N-terminal cleavage/methylation domain-containing protein [Patescibacteria group bacterium]MBU2219064.1 prepilin-type N-terminal cleavage/methylation domain-containing protein [Patescibacteria group bacterium]MBU2263497.1 prepilin-type N-terminal cleavage/methylation domain-containing protein [Patescibacteria group bacterium]
MSHGFTLIELLIVIALGIIIVAITVPIGLNFYNNQILDEASKDILSTLRKAQSYSMFQKNNSAFGIKFLSDSYVLFQGVSYGARTQSQDEIFNLASGISTSGVNEIVFSRIAGTTTASTLTIRSGNNNQVISINTYGKAEIQ